MKAKRKGLLLNEPKKARLKMQTVSLSPGYRVVTYYGYNPAWATEVCFLV